MYDGLPTKYLLTKKDDNYVVSIEDYENYKFLGDKYILYKHNLYIMKNDEAEYLSLLQENKIKELVFSKKDLKVFNMIIVKFV